MELANPRPASGEPGKHKEGTAPAGDRAQWLPLVCADQDCPYDDCADEGSEVRIDILDADLCKDRG